MKFRQQLLVLVAVGTFAAGAAAVVSNAVAIGAVVGVAIGVGYLVGRLAE